MLKRFRALFFLCLLTFSSLIGCAETVAPAPPTVTPISRVTVVVVTALPTATRTPLPTATPPPTLSPTPAATPTPFLLPPAAGQPVSIPILMYHHLKYRSAADGAALKTWSVAPNAFAAQLDYFQQRGFHTITFKQLVDFFENSVPLPPNPILLTFDDGWIDNYTVAFPELHQRGMVGNFFPPTRYANAGGELLINWDQVLEMDRAGMEFGGHTIDHKDLTAVSPEEMRRQLVDGKARMEEKLGHPIYAFAYPFGAFNPRVVAETGNAGYKAALILCCGYEVSSDGLLTLPRIRISYDDTISDIAEKLP